MEVVILFLDNEQKNSKVKVKNYEEHILEVLSKQFYLYNRCVSKLSRE